MCARWGKGGKGNGVGARVGARVRGRSGVVKGWGMLLARNR